MTVDEDKLRALADRILRKAGGVRNNAAHAGSMDDGGAFDMECEVEVFLAGLERRVPEQWQGEAEAMEREADPEWGEYRRLARKFGGKA